MDAIIRRAVLAVARETTTEGFCRTLVTALNGPTSVLIRVWVAGFDGVLQLTGSAGRPIGGGTYNRLDGGFSRIPLGLGKIGGMCSGQPFVVRSIRGDEPWLENPGWIARQAVRAFIGYPLIAGDEVVGALAIFERAAPSDETLEALRFVADYAALRVVDLRDRALIHERLAAREQADPVVAADSPRVPAVHPVVTRAELRLLERQAIETALAQTRGRVFGPRGAAALLGMKPTTLASRIKALRIDRGGS